MELRAERAQAAAFPDCLLRAVGVGSAEPGDARKGRQRGEQGPAAFLGPFVPFGGAPFSPFKCYPGRTRSKLIGLSSVPLRGAIGTFTGGGIMRSMLIVLATAVSTALLACGVAVADTVTTNFEGLNR